MPNLKWFTERPTKSGNYWLSVHPNKRGAAWEAVEYVRVTVYPDGSSFVQKIQHNTIFDRKNTNNDIFDGAQWTLHDLPSDPFVLSVETTPDSKLEATTSRRAPIAAQSPMWIKSTDRLPKNDIVCWVVITATQAVEVRCFNNHWKCWDRSGDDFMNKIEAVSHWQPIIKPATPRGVDPGTDKPNQPVSSCVG